MRVGMNIDQTDPWLSTEQFGANEHLPPLVVHPEDAKSETQEDGFITPLQVENWHFMNPIIELSFPTQILFVFWFVK